MKNILLLAHDDRGQESRLRCALELTRAMSGHLLCLDVTRQPIFLQDYASTAGGMIALVDEEQREAANASGLRARLASEDISYEVVEAAGDIADALVQHAQLADALVVSCRGLRGEVPDMMDVASDVVLNARSPIVVVPETVRSLKVTGPMLLAWDGSSSVIAAMKAAVPVLKLASKIILYSVDGADLDVTCEDAARYLSRYGVHVEIERNNSDGIVTEDIYIRNACERHGVGLCVMGAYGHSRRMEDIFGGVTRRMLVKTECPLMIAH